MLDRIVFSDPRTTAMLKAEAREVLRRSRKAPKRLKGWRCPACSKRVLLVELGRCEHGWSHGDAGRWWVKGDCARCGARVQFSKSGARVLTRDHPGVEMVTTTVKGGTL